MPSWLAVAVLKRRNTQFFSYPYLLPIWNACGIDDLHQCCTNVSLSKGLVSWRECDVKLRVKAAFLAWVLWGDRNSLIFNKSAPPNVLIAHADIWVDKSGYYMQQIYKPRASSCQSSSSVWLPPSWRAKIERRCLSRS